MRVTLAVLLVVGVAGSGLAAWLLTSVPRRFLSPEREVMRQALHHASATLPHLRKGLDERSARNAVSHLRALTQAGAVAITSRTKLLALDGIAGPDASPERLLALSDWVVDGRVHVDPGRRLVKGGAPQRGAVVAPLMIQEEHVGAVVALYGSGHRLRPDDARVVREAAALISAQVELSSLADQEERLTRAELHALRARISPHFVYNSLAAIASFIHSRPDEARLLLTEFAEFTRYAFRRERKYVTLAEELHYVQKYLALEQARFGDRLIVRVQVAPEVLQVAVPVLSMQPLVENAIRHGIELRSGQGLVEIVAIDRDVDVEIRISDDGAGMDEQRAAAALSGETEGLGMHNVDRRLRAIFGEEYGLEIESEPQQGTTVRMIVPKFRVGVRAA